LPCQGKSCFEASACLYTLPPATPHQSEDARLYAPPKRGCPFACSAKARMPVCMLCQSEDACLYALPKRGCPFVCSAKARMPVCMPHHAPPTKERKIVLPFPDSQAFLKNMSPRAWVMSKVGQNRCVHSIFGRKIAEYTVTYGVYIRFWPTLVMSSGIHTISRPQLHNDVPLDLRDHSCWLSQQ
jgi:hypothetical protein